MNNLKKLLLLSGVFFICNTGYAQIGTNKENYQQFSRSFYSVIDYPVELIRSCTPVVCLIKVQVDTAKNITDMKLSDSADSIMVVEFKRHKHSLDIKSLAKYLKTEYGNNNCATYIIPLSYSLIHMPCPAQSVNAAVLNRYSRFDGHDLNGAVIFLPPLATLLSVQR